MATIADAARMTARPIAPEPPRLTDEARRWIAENLLLGAPDTVILERLAQRGCPKPLAEHEIGLAKSSPYFQGAGVMQQRLKKRDWLLETLSSLATTDGGLDQAPRASRLPAKNFFRDHYALSRPVLIEGLFDHWPAMQLWSLDYFEQKLGDIEVQVQVGRDKSAAYEMEANKHRELMPLKRLLDMLRADPQTNDFYVTAGNDGHNRAALAPLWGDVGEIPGYLDFTGANRGFFWMGPRGTVTPFHHDLTNNLLIQISGRKRVAMVPAIETPLMRNWKHVFSAFTGPEEIAALPADHRPHMIVCTIEPGQALFLPVGWWHHVVGIDQTIGMSFTNFTRPNDFYSSYDTYGQL